MDSLDIAEAAGREFEAHNWEARLGADSSTLQGEIASAQRMGEAFDGQNYDAKLGADTAGLVAGAAQANSIADSVAAMKADVRIDGDTSALQTSAAQATAIAAAIEGQKATVHFDGDTGSLLNAAGMARTAVASVPNSKTTRFDGDSGILVQAARNALAAIRGIPSMVRTSFSIVNDPTLILNRIRSAIQGIQNAPPTRINMDTSQVRQASVALTGVERGMIRVGSAAATMRNAMGRDGSMFTRLAAGAVALSQGLARAVGGILRFVGIATTMGQAASSAAAGTAAMAASVAQTGQAATGAAASVGSVAAGITGMASAALLAGPAVLVLAAGIVVLGGALGAILAVLAPISAMLLILVGTLAAVGAGFVLIGAAGLKLATDFGTVYAATQRVKDAQIALNAARASGDTDRIAEAEKELAQAQNAAAVAAEKASGASKEYATQLQRMGTELDQLKAKFSDAFSGAATELARISANTMELAQTHLPALGQAAEQSVIMMEDGFKRGVDSSTSLKDILDQIPPIMQNISETVSSVGSAFTSFLDVAMPLILQFTQYCEDLAAKLATWADSQAGRDQIREFLEAAVPIAQAFADGIAQVGTMLGTLANEHAPAAEAAVTFFFDAVTFGISALEVLLGALESIIGALGTLIGLAKDAAAAIASIGSGPAPSGPANPSWAYGGDMHTMAEGGDVQAFAGGGDSGAHFVNGPRTMDVGGSTALYGEALSGNNREYAFPLGGGWRFITEQPGFDMQSFGLWADLGNRQGFFDAIGAGAGARGGSGGETDAQTGSPALPSMQGDSRAQGGDASRMEHLVRHTNDAAGRANTAATNGERRIETAIKTMEKILEGGLRQVAAETARIPERIKGAVDSNNVFDKNTRTSVLKGLTREASKGAFEGSLH